MTHEKDLMKRILIIGSGGAGKSTLAIKLAKNLSLPLVHLDCLFWKPGWVQRDKGEFRETLETVLEQPTWIIDGNFGSTMARRFEYADTIIFLNLPTLTCLYGIFSRYFQYRKQSRPDMTEGNNERIDLEFFLYVLFYNRQRRPLILSRLNKIGSDKKTIILRSRKEIKAFLASSLIAKG